jgi:hypothetical protein
MVDLEELEQLANAATPGPWLVRRIAYGDADFGSPPQWEAGDDEDADEASVTHDGRELLFDPCGQALDSRFVVAARAAVPELCAEVRQLRARVAGLEADPRMQVPLDGPGSHRADLAEQHALRDELAKVERQRDRYGAAIDRMRAEIRRLKERNEGLRTGLAFARHQLGRVGARLGRLRNSRERWIRSARHGVFIEYFDGAEQLARTDAWAKRWKTAAKVFLNRMRWASKAADIAASDRRDAERWAMDSGKKLERAQWKSEQRREVILELQWSSRICSHPDPLCFVCRNFETQGHREGCRVAEALNDDA